MKVLILSDGIFPFEMGGMQKHTHYLCRYLSAAQTDLHLAHCTDKTIDGSDLETEYSKLGVPTENVYMAKFPILPPFPGHYIVSSYLYSLRLYKHYKDQLKSFDLIYAQGFTAWHLLRASSKTGRPPVVVNLHGLEMYQPAYSFREKLEKALLKIPASGIIRRADYLQSLGGKLSGLLSGLTDKSRILECSIGIEEQWIASAIRPSSDNKRSFIFIGRMEHRKGLHILNPVLRELISEPGFEMHFIGPVADKDKINSENLIYHGRINDEVQIRSILDRCDCLVLPSLSEGMPTVILEAMARGCAILATDVGAVGALLVSGNGVIMQAGSTESLKASVKQILNIPSGELDQMKRASLKSVQNYTWEKVSEKMLSQFKGIGSCP